MKTERKHNHTNITQLIRRAIKSLTHKPVISRVHGNACRGTITHGPVGHPAAQALTRGLAARRTGMFARRLDRKGARGPCARLNAPWHRPMRSTMYGGPGRCRVSLCSVQAPSRQAPVLGLASRISSVDSRRLDVVAAPVEPWQIQFNH